MRRNRPNRPNSWLLAVALLAPLVAVACGTTYSSPPPAPPRGDLEGARYERMRVLSGRLVNRLQATRDELRTTRNREADTPLFGELLDQARRLRDRLENLSDPPRYVSAEVSEIDRLARQYEAETRTVSASTRAVENWTAAQDLINQMQTVVSGGYMGDLPPDDVVAPYPPYPTNPPYGDNSPYGTVLSGVALDDVRRTAHELVVRATLARDATERAGTSYSDADRRLSADLSYFVSGAKELETRANAATSVDRRDLRPFIERLNEDARRLDVSLRGSSTYSRAGDWAEVLRLLQRLSDQTR